VVALTFDDGPDPVWTPRILDELARARAHATFFVLTERAARHPEIVERTRAEGHGVQLHGHLHLRHPRAGEAAVREDLAAALRVFGTDRRRGHGGADVPTQWRVPWGDLAPFSAALAAEHGLTLAGWTADTEDWRDRPAPALLRAVEPGLQPGAIVLAHDGIGPGAERATARATAELIGPLVDAIRARGLTPARLDEAWPHAIPVGNPARMGKLDA
jgi:peptidoglycan/xylan/chitin deacetylase (PgdA/CDA1 family)